MSQLRPEIQETYMRELTDFVNELNRRSELKITEEADEHVYTEEGYTDQ